MHFSNATALMGVLSMALSQVLLCPYKVWRPIDCIYNTVLDDVNITISVGLAAWLSNDTIQFDLQHLNRQCFTKYYRWTLYLYRSSRIAAGLNLGLLNGTFGACQQKFIRSRIILFSLRTTVVMTKCLFPCKFTIFLRLFSIRFHPILDPKLENRSDQPYHQDGHVEMINIHIIIAAHLDMNGLAYSTLIQSELGATHQCIIKSGIWGVWVTMAWPTWNWLHYWSNHAQTADLGTQWTVLSECWRVSHLCGTWWW